MKRAYDKPAAEDGLRILIDRLWPRGLTKDKAAIDHWFKRSPPARNYASGFHTIPSDGASFADATSANSKPMFWK